MSVAVDPKKTLATTGVLIVDRSAVAVSAPADVTEDTLATVNLPALGPNDQLRITTLWSFTANVNNKTMRVRLSGAAGTQYLNLTFTSVSASKAVTTISNRGATNSQVGESVMFINNNSILTNATVTSAVDMSVATTLVITGQKAVNTDALTLEQYLVELIPG